MCYDNGNQKTFNMIINDIISDVEIRENAAALLLPNGFEILVSTEFSDGITSGMAVEVELCKNLVKRLSINGKVIFSKTKEQLIPEIEILEKELTVEAEDERRMAINLESNKKLAKLIPIFKIRINILQANDKSFMQLKDWRRELKACEIAQNIFFSVKNESLWEKCKMLNADALTEVYPDFKKLDKNIGLSVLSLTNALFEDCRQGINPEDEASVRARLFYSRVMKIPNIICEEVRVMDIVRYGG